MSSKDNEIAFEDESGETRLHMGEYFVRDASGVLLASAMEVRNGDILYRYDDTAAVYPVEIDPLMWSAEDDLFATGGSMNDQFGVGRVAISGDTAVIGTNLVDGGQGAAYVFVRSGSTWAQQDKLVQSPRESGNNFGSRVDIDGNTIVVGATGDDVDLSNQGTATVFVRIGSTWSLQEELTMTLPGVSDQFGVAVAVDEDTIAVGANNDDLGETDQGSVTVFTRSGTDWAEQQVVFDGDGHMGEGFGEGVALAGDTLVVSAQGDEVGANGNQGSVVVFTRSGTTWSSGTKLTASLGQAGDFFGSSVAITESGSYIAIGALARSSLQGSVFVFSTEGGVWSEIKELVPLDVVGGDQFGRSVAITEIGGRVIVAGGSSEKDDGGNSNEGAVYLFERSLSGEWTVGDRVTRTDGAAADYFGGAIDISGLRLIDASNGDDVSASSDQGSATIFLLQSQLGDSCVDDDECATGYCADGVCCDSACGAGADDCQACSAALGAGSDGTCTILGNETMCRAIDNDCDAPEWCSGSGLECPSDLAAADGTTCNGDGVCTDGECSVEDPDPDGGSSAGPDSGSTTGPDGGSTTTPGGGGGCSVGLVRGGGLSILLLGFGWLFARSKRRR